MHLLGRHDVGWRQRRSGSPRYAAPRARLRRRAALGEAARSPGNGCRSSPRGGAVGRGGHGRRHPRWRRGRVRGFGGTDRALEVQDRRLRRFLTGRGPGPGVLRQPEPGRLRRRCDHRPAGLALRDGEDRVLFSCNRRRDRLRGQPRRQPVCAERELRQGALAVQDCGSGRVLAGGWAEPRLRRQQ
jgi:hypothetical protein